MRISGPNAEGFYSEVQRVAATFSPTVDVKPDAPRLAATRRRIGIVAQSGGIGFAISHRAKALGIGLSYVVSTGNEADLGAGEFLDYLVQDPATDVILLFIEGIRDVDKFLVAARRAAQSGKPVIVTKVGRSGAANARRPRTPRAWPAGRRPMMRCSPNTASSFPVTKAIARVRAELIHPIEFRSPRAKFIALSRASPGGGEKRGQT